ncbi:MAG: cytochrome C [Nitrospirae bacterium]|nr:cytochrome C [Nitrospirota bacterium]
MKNNIIFAVFVLVVLGFFFSISGKKYPQIPANDAHKELTGSAACLSCHGPEGERPRKPSHPPKDDCLKCHKKKRVKAST